ncbi:MAG: ABC transporter permease, partial [Deltaproteobacteria bacterium]|nr:ABC transporter permease [Deltaproteobacteria bacterium]
MKPSSLPEVSPAGPFLPRLRVVKRREPLTWGSWLVTLGAVILSLGLSALLLKFQGKSPLQGMILLWTGAFGSLWAVEDCLLKSVPIFLCALGVALTFRLQIWNLGAEGQFALGALGAAWVALRFPSLPSYTLLPAMGLMASLTGGLWGLIPAILKLRLRTNEIIVTLMLNYIGILLLEYKVYGSWKDPSSFGFPMTPEFPAGGIVGLIGATRLHWGIALCIAVGLVMAVTLRYSRAGYELRASGESVRVARYARLPYARMVVAVMIVGGALAGLAGFLEASATTHRLQP